MASNILLLLTIFLAPLYVVRFNLGSLPSTLLEVLILGTVISFGIEILATKSKWPKLAARFISPMLGPAAALLVVGLVGIIVNPNHHAALGLWRAYILEPVLIYVVVIDKLRQGKLNQPLLLAWIASGTWVSALAILQKFTGQFTTAYSAHELSLGRAAAVFNSANDVPLFLGPIAAMGVPLVRYRRWIILPLILIFLAIWISGSRGGALGLGVVETIFALGWIWSKISQSWRDKLKRVSLVLGVITAGVAIYLFINISAFTPAHKIVYPRPYAGTTEVRLCLWEGTKDLLLAHPIFGVGLGGFASVYPAYRTCDSEELVYPHNIVLNIWAELGVAGLALFGWIYWRSFSMISSAETSKLVKLSLAGALIYSLIHGIVDVPYFKNDLSLEFWLLLGIIVAVKERKLRFE